MQEEQSASRRPRRCVTKLLPVLDTLDLAQAHQSETSAESDDAKALERGARPCCSMSLDERKGLSVALDEAAVPFDPSHATHAGGTGTSRRTARVSKKSR